MNVKPMGLLFLAGCVALALTARPVAGAGGPVAEVERAERSRFEAMVKKDVGGLKELLSDDMTYGQSDGRMESKEDFLASLQNGDLSYVSIRPAEMNVRVYGETAVVTGLADMVVAPRTGNLAIRVRFTDVYVLRAGRWVMVAWQSAQVPAP